MNLSGLIYLLIAVIVIVVLLILFLRLVDAADSQAAGALTGFVAAKVSR